MGVKACDHSIVNGKYYICEECSSNEEKRLAPLFDEINRFMEWTSEIKVYPFHKAPPCLKALSTNGGDEDWIVYVPDNIWKQDMEERTPFWIEAMDSLHSPQEYHTPDTNHHIFIASH